MTEELIFTAQLYATAVYAVVVCPSVCQSVHLSIQPSVCMSHAGIVPKRLYTQTTPYQYIILSQISVLLVF